MIWCTLHMETLTLIFCHHILITSAHWMSQLQHIAVNGCTFVLRHILTEWSMNFDNIRMLWLNFYCERFVLQMVWMSFGEQLKEWQWKRQQYCIQQTLIRRENRLNRSSWHELFNSFTSIDVTSGVYRSSFSYKNFFFLIQMTNKKYFHK